MMEVTTIICWTNLYYLVIGIVQCMSRNGNCLNNTTLENFFGIVKSELFYLKKHTSLDQLKQEINEDINY